MNTTTYGHLAAHEVSAVIPECSSPLIFEAGRFARQANGAVYASMGSARVLATVCFVNDGSQADFLRLTVNYIEKFYAKGEIPHSFHRREARPCEEETLISRAIDRMLRPLIPKGISHNIQVMITVLSTDEAVSLEMLAANAASAAVAISGLPTKGTVASLRVGRQDDGSLFHLAPCRVEGSSLDLTIAATDQAVIMVESSAHELSEETMIAAINQARQWMQPIHEAIATLKAQVAREVDQGQFEVAELPQPASLTDKMLEPLRAQIEAAYQVKTKADRVAKLSAVRQDFKAAHELDDEAIAYFQHYVGQLEREVVRSRYLTGNERIDGRAFDEVRPISIQVDLLPASHGSALFTRGETQALVTSILGTDKDAQLIDHLSLYGGEEAKRDTFMLHYNFPPFSTGEVSMALSTKRREIGHGNLAKRALKAVMPTYKDFPYVHRIVSEILESNGSSSMATVCGGSLALMDAGVPLKAPVAGIAMGLVSGDANQCVILSDILGDEDHLGDMDFKVAGTAEGITALQMDIKIDGLSDEVLTQALEQAKAGRLHILGEMNKVLSASRDEVSHNAPRIITMSVHKDKIREVIGKGGATIRGIIEQYGVTVDINDDGLVKIFSTNSEQAQKAKAHIEDLVHEVQVGALYYGVVVKIIEYGAFLALPGGKDGFLHISQIADHRVEDIYSELSEGQEVKVQVQELDRQGRIRLTAIGLDD